MKLSVSASCLLALAGAHLALASPILSRNGVDIASSPIPSDPELHIDPFTDLFVGRIYHSNGTEVSFEDYVKIHALMTNTTAPEVTVIPGAKPPKQADVAGDFCWHTEGLRKSGSPRYWETGHNRVSAEHCSDDKIKQTFSVGYTYTRQASIDVRAKLGKDSYDLGGGITFVQSATSTLTMALEVPLKHCGVLVFQAKMVGHWFEKTGQHCCSMKYPPCQSEYVIEKFYADSPVSWKDHNGNNVLDGRWSPQSWRNPAYPENGGGGGGGSGGGGGNGNKKGEWATCNAHTECKNNCCSAKYSNGVKKCTPNGC
ncbi:hypothetical protein BC832DRAFT_461062 [Gaertneriomyces semiglobifer]|nr:hypothetical protein BC832DRAFT_461062 [Gaertneriomyces semiglobifer]